jgi:hypothetical protein
MDKPQWLADYGLPVFQALSDAVLLVGTLYQSDQKPAPPQQMPDNSAKARLNDQGLSFEPT